MKPVLITIALLCAGCARPVEERSVITRFNADPKESYSLGWVNAKNTFRFDESCLCAFNDFNIIETYGGDTVLIEIIVTGNTEGTRCENGTLIMTTLREVERAIKNRQHYLANAEIGKEIVRKAISRYQALLRRCPCDSLE